MQPATPSSTSVRDDLPDLGSESTSKSCFAIVWIKDAKQSLFGDTLLDLVARHEGVASVRYGKAKPNVLVVDYDAERTRAKSILEVLSREGVMGQIVGC